MTLKKINILEYAFGEGGGGHQKAYAVYAFINVDNCERPLRKKVVSYYYLSLLPMSVMGFNFFLIGWVVEVRELYPVLFWIF